MIQLIRDYQVQILIGASILCLILAGFVWLIQGQSIAKKKALFFIELLVSVLLVSDAMEYIYEGNSDKVGFVMARVTNFIVFFLICGIIFLFNRYMTSLFMETGKFQELPKGLKIGFMVPSVGMLLVIISQFTGMYYYFDSNNVYHRGNLYLLACIIPYIAMMIQLVFIISHRQLLGITVTASIVVFTSLPLIGGVVQFFYIGVSAISLAIGISAVLLFGAVLADLNTKLAKAAYIEMETGLPNSHGYQAEVDKVIHQKKITDYCGYYLDMVRMSQFNNKYGKRKGDEIIYKYAWHIRKALDDDEILGRLGGNYFVALVKKSNTDKFLKLIADVPVEIEFEGRDELVHVSTTAGVYEIKQKNVVAGQILGNTSAAVNYAKNVAHKSVVFFDVNLEKEFIRIRQLEENVRRALVAKEFEPFYQPKVDTNGNVLCGAEALVRWRYDGKLIPPGEFIPIIEKNGSVCALDFYVLEHVCEDIKGWIEKGYDPVTVSVNFSRRNLGNPILSEAISNVVEKYGIPKNLIQIEVTETLDEYPMSYLVGVIEALHRYGMSAAIDDFGTGSSSIHLLKDVEFDVLKIDRSLADFSNDKEKQLVGDIILMAQHMGIDIIAEGIEDSEHVEALKEMGCSKIQGFFFDRPMEKAEFEKRMVSRVY